MAGRNLLSVYSALRSRFGFLGWWPGENRDEIIIGAILTQNTNWRNVEKAILNLRDEGMLNLKKLSTADSRKIQNLIKPSGSYRQKSARLKKLSTYIYANYSGLDAMFSKDTMELRNELLSLDGIGPETADAIALYAAEKPIFVIDAYTRRIMSRLNGTDSEYDYETLQKLISSSIEKDVGLYKDFHAQFDQLGKSFCRKEPLCGSCPLKRICSYPKSRTKMH